MNIDQSAKPVKTWQDRVGGWPSHPLDRELNQLRDIDPGGSAARTNERKHLTKLYRVKRVC